MSQSCLTDGPAFATHPADRLADRRPLRELMDDPQLNRRDHQRALAGLRRINRLSFVAPIMFREMRRMTKDVDRPIRVLDVACGSGDLAIDLALAARRRGLDWRVDGCDKSETAVEDATDRAAKARVGSQFLVADALHGELPVGYDVLTCCLFLHHLENRSIIGLLRAMAHAARVGIIINDLRRTGPHRALARIVPRLITRSPIVHTDAVRSVNAALRMPELRRLMNEAGLEGATVRPSVFQRMIATWRRP